MQALVECDPRRAAVTRAHAAVFLDRDGVLIRAPVVDGVPARSASVDELELEQGAAEACAALHDAGFLLVMVTNQPEIARGNVSREAVDAMHERLGELLPLDDMRVCPHDDADDCACRKPKPGMLLDAARELGIDLAAELHRRRPLEGHRSRSTGRLHDRLPGPSVQ